MTRGLFLLAVILGAGLLLCCAPRVQPGTASSEAGEEIRVSRGPCFGFCPVYSVAVTPAGRVDFTGDRHTEVLGPRSHSVGREAYETVRGRLARLRPATGRTEALPCPVAQTDTALVTVEWIAAGGARTALTWRMGCPSAAGEDMERLLDDQLLLLGVDRWAAQRTWPGVPRG